MRVPLLWILQVFVRTDQVTSGNDGAAAATAAAASGSSNQATSQSLDWVYGEHSSGASGWFPRCAGNFFSFSSANSLAALQLQPLDSQGGTFALGSAITRNELPAPKCRALLVDALKTLWRCEGLYVQALGVLVGGFIQPLEMRDSKAKQALLADPYLAICANQLRDLFFYHSQFFKACGLAATGLDHENGLESKSEGGAAADEQQQLLALATSLSALISRFTLYREYVSNLPAAFDALFSTSGKLGKPLAKFLEQHPLPLLDVSDSSSSEEKSSKGGAAAAAAAAATAAKNNLAARLEVPAKHYREYLPVLELLLRCVEVSVPGGRSGGGGSSGNNNSSSSSAPAAAATAALGACFVDLNKATSTVDLARASSLTNARLLELQSQFVGRVQVVSKGRQLLQGGKLFKIHASDKTSATKEQRVVHLFNDVLIYSIPMAGGRLQFRK